MAETKKRSNAEFLKWFRPVIESLKALGGSGTPEEVRQKIIKDLTLPESVTTETYGKNNTNKFANQVAFARNYLVYAGYIDKSQQGIWSLTDSGSIVDMNEDLASDIFISYAPKHVNKEIFSYDERIEQFISFYRDSFSKHWKDEKYKWEAIKVFQDNWDINAKDFKTMFEKATSAASNLLTSYNHYPRSMILNFCDIDSKAVQNMFAVLYDEHKDIKERLSFFKSESERIKNVHNASIAGKVAPDDKGWGMTYQDENAISTYLWLRYPDKYYIYKYGEVIKVEKFLSDSPVIKKGEGEANFITTIALYNKICEELKKDETIIKQFSEALTPDCYNDPQYRTLTIDAGFAFSRYFDSDEIEEDEISENTGEPNIWLYSPGENARYWDKFKKEKIMAIGWGEVGSLNQLCDLSEVKAKMKKIWGDDKTYKNDGLAVWQFAYQVKPGDIVFVKQGMSKIVGRGVVLSNYKYDESQPEHYNHVYEVEWTHDGEWTTNRKLPMKTLTRINVYKDMVKSLNELLNVDNTESSEKVIEYPAYTEDNFLNEVFMTPEKYQTMIKLLERKKNIILQGAPGVGKTFAAKRLAYSLLGEKNPNRVQMVQFHQSYSYEDFIVGFRPSENENKQFEKTYGVFYNFCKDAEDDKENNYYFIIDEINRGNMSKIFGELLMLIESDKRGQQLRLLYADELFSVPDNVYIIGMMNTADRSLAIIDYALRRRFAFVEFEPGFETNGFIALQNQIGNEKYNKLVDQVKALNDYIAKDLSLGKGFRIGHSYLIPKKVSDVDNEWLSDVVDYEIIPLLEEYWFDESQKLDTWSNNLRNAIK